MEQSPFVYDPPTGFASLDTVGAIPAQEGRENMQVKSEEGKSCVLLKPSCQYALSKRLAFRVEHTRIIVTPIYL